MAQPLQPYATLDEYFWEEENSPERFEYLDSLITMMAGGTNTHNRIAANTIVEIGQQVRSKNCGVYPGMQRIGIATTRNFLYADISVVCGDPQFTPNRNDTITNPVLIDEVLLPSTEKKDRGEKWEQYQTIPALKHYVLVNQFRPRGEVWTRTDNGGWLVRFYTDLDENVPIDALGIELSLRSIYDGITFEPPRVQ